MEIARCDEVAEVIEDEVDGLVVGDCDGVEVGEVEGIDVLGVRVAILSKSPAFHLI